MVLASIKVAWPSAAAPYQLARWASVFVECTTLMYAAIVLVHARLAPVADRVKWRANLGLRSVMAPVFWLVVSAAGAWSATIATQDVLGPYLLQHTDLVAPLVGVTVWLRLGLSALVDVSTRIPDDVPRWADVGWVPMVGLVTALALRYGLPIWGWM